MIVQDRARGIALQLLILQAVGFSRFAEESGILGEFGAPSSARIRVVLLLCAAFVFLLAGRPRIVGAAPLTAFLAFVTASIIWSVSPMQSAVGATLLVTTSLFYCALAASMPTRDILLGLRDALSTMIAVGLALYLVGNEATETIDYLTLNVVGRNGLVGVFEHNVFGGVLATVNAVLVVHLPYRSRPLNWFVLITSGTFLVLSDSRSAWALSALAMSLVGYASLRGAGPRAKLLAASLISLAAAAGAALLANLSATTAFLGRSDDLTGRIPLWSSAVTFASERPLTGWGYASIFGDDGYLARTGIVAGKGNWEAPHFHNDLLQVLAELGLLGVALFCALLVSALRWPVEASDRTHSEVTTARIVLALLIAYAFIGEIFAAQKFGWLFVVVMATKAASQRRILRRARRAMIASTSWSLSGGRTAAGTRLIP